jgi:hypothetical protein
MRDHVGDKRSVVVALAEVQLVEGLLVEAVLVEGQLVEDAPRRGKTHRAVHINHLGLRSMS